MSSEAAIELGRARIVWDLDRLRAIRAGETEPPCRIEEEPDWSAVEQLRLIAASFEDRSALAVAALLPADAAGHDAEAVAGFLVSPDGEVGDLREVLISTERGPDGRVRRLGMELYEAADSIPLRVAADGERAMSFRLGGRAGSGVYEVLRRR